MADYKWHDMLVVKILPDAQKVAMDGSGALEPEGNIRRYRTTNREEVLAKLVQFGTDVPDVFMRLSLHTIAASYEITITYDPDEYELDEITERALNIVRWNNKPPQRSYALADTGPSLSNEHFGLA
jgi:hypothetical protein